MTKLVLMPASFRPPIENALNPSAGLEERFHSLAAAYPVVDERNRREAMYQIPIIGGQLNYPHLYDGMAAFTYMEPPVPRLRKGRNWAFPALSNIKLLDQFSAETIEAVHAALCQSPHGFRRGPIATLPDQDGGRIVFPSPEDAHDLI